LNNSHDTRPAFRIRDGWIAVTAILVIFCAKYLPAMLQQNALWRSGAWYEFLETPSVASQAGLLDRVAMAPYYRTLSISLGHQLIAAINAWLGFEMGTAFLYVAIAVVFIAAVFLLSRHVTGSSVAAFAITLVIVNTDALAMAHIGACGSLAQAPGRDYMALGFILLGFYFLLESRLYLYWLCLYAGFLLHLPHGSYAFALLLPLTVLRARNRRFLVFHLVSFALTVAVLFGYQSTGGTPLEPQTQALWFKWVYIFNGGHIFFDHSVHYLVPNFAFFSVLLAGLAIAAARPNQRAVVLTIVPVWVLIALATTFFVYVMPVMLVHQLTPYRSSLPVSAILLILLLKVFIDQLSSGAGVWTAVLAPIGVVALMSGTFTGVCLAAAIGCVILAVEQPGRIRLLCLAAALGCAGFLVVTIQPYAIYDAFVVRRDRQEWIFALSVLLALSIVRRWRPALWPSRNLVSATAAATVLVLSAVTPSRYLATAQSGTTLEKLNDFLAASAVVTEHSTASDPVLAAPLIDMPMLEVTAGRGSVLQLVKAHVPYLAPGLLPSFDRTLRQFGIDIANFEGTWEDLTRDAPGIWKKTATAERLRDLGVEHHARLVVTYADHQLDLPALHRGPYFTVYELWP
jgi:hypothetical protein